MPKHTPVLVGAAMARLGARLKTARKLRKMSRDDLAHLSDVSLSTLRSLESGVEGVSLGNLLKVLQGLDLLQQFDDLLDPVHDPEAIAFALDQIGAR